MANHDISTGQSPMPSASSSTLGYIPEVAGEEMSVDGESGIEVQIDNEKLGVAESPGLNVPPTNAHSDLVEFNGPDDPENPKNWSPAKKWGITASMGAMTFVVTFSSSIYVSSGSAVLVRGLN